MTKKIIVVLVVLVLVLVTVHYGGQIFGQDDLVGKAADEELIRLAEQDLAIAEDSRFPVHIRARAAGEIQGIVDELYWNPPVNPETDQKIGDWADKAWNEVKKEAITNDDRLHYDSAREYVRIEFADNTFDPVAREIKHLERRISYSLTGGNDLALQARLDELEEQRAAAVGSLDALPFDEFSDPPKQLDVLGAADLGELDDADLEVRLAELTEPTGDAGYFDMKDGRRVRLGPNLRVKEDGDVLHTLVEYDPILAQFGVPIYTPVSYIVNKKGQYTDGARLYDSNGNKFNNVRVGVGVDRSGTGVVSAGSLQPTYGEGRFVAINQEKGEFVLYEKHLDRESGIMQVTQANHDGDAKVVLEYDQSRYPELDQIDLSRHGGGNTFVIENGVLELETDGTTVKGYTYTLGEGDEATTFLKTFTSEEKVNWEVTESIKTGDDIVKVERAIGQDDVKITFPNDNVLYMDSHVFESYRSRINWGLTTKINKQNNDEHLYLNSGQRLVNNGMLYNLETKYEGLWRNDVITELIGSTHITSSYNLNTGELMGKRENRYFDSGGSIEVTFAEKLFGGFEEDSVVLSYKTGEGLRQIDLSADEFHNVLGDREKAEMTDGDFSGIVAAVEFFGGDARAVKHTEVDTTTYTYTNLDKDTNPDNADYQTLAFGENSFEVGTYEDGALSFTDETYFRQDAVRPYEENLQDEYGDILSTLYEAEGISAQQLINLYEIDLPARFGMDVKAGDIIRSRNFQYSEEHGGDIPQMRIQTDAAGGVLKVVEQDAGRLTSTVFRGVDSQDSITTVATRDSEGSPMLLELRYDADTNLMIDNTRTYSDASKQAFSFGYDQRGDLFVVKDGDAIEVQEVRNFGGEDGYTRYNIIDPETQKVVWLDEDVEGFNIVNPENGEVVNVGRDAASNYAADRPDVAEIQLAHEANQRHQQQYNEIQKGQLDYLIEALGEFVDAIATVGQVIGRLGHKFLTDILPTALNYLQLYKPMHATSSLLFDDAFLDEWREDVDREFAKNYLGVEYWKSEICTQEFPISGGNIASIETAGGLFQFLARVEGDKSEEVDMLCEDGVCAEGTCRPLDNVCVDNHGTSDPLDDTIIQQRFYKITYGVTAPSDRASTPHSNEDGAISFNIVVSSTSKTAPLFDNFIHLENGEGKQDVIVKYSQFNYDKVCIVFGKKAQDRKGDEVKKVCDKITQTKKSFVKFKEQKEAADSGEELLGGVEPEVQSVGDW